MWYRSAVRCWPAGGAPVNRTRKYILAIDQGTTGSRAFIFDHRGKAVASAYKEFQQHYPKPGWVEHDGGEIWNSVEGVIREAVSLAGIDPKWIAAIGITNQRETTLLWDRQTGRPYHRAIVWQCRRTARACARLQRHAPLFREVTGLVLDAYFSGTKVQWFFEHVPGLRRKAREGRVAFGTMDTWLIYKLTGGQAHATDMTNASRTLLYDIEARAWSLDLLQLLDIPDTILPCVLPSSAVFGHTVAGIAGLPAGIPITGVMGDQQAALYGQGCFTPGSIKNTYGTGCFMLLNTGQRRVHSRGGLLTTLACDATGAPVFALEGSVFMAGAVVQWMRDELKIIPDSSSTERMIEGLEDTHGVYVVPAFTGLGAPYWRPEARGLITGLTRGANVRHIIRAGLESMAYQTRDVFDLMRRESGFPVKALAVDGGASRNDFLMQFQADILGVEVRRPRQADATVTGAAYLAGVAAGLWTPERVALMQAQERCFKPGLPAARVRELYSGWQKAVSRALV